MAHAHQDNYAEWSMVMKVKMQARRMWDAVRYGDADFDEDRQALEALLADALLPREQADRQRLGRHRRGTHRQ